MKKVLVAGATGYLGQYLVKELKKRHYWVRVLIRKEHQKRLFESVDDYFIGEITAPKTLVNITKDIDWVFSTIGITRQKDGLQYMDVDYQGNANLLQEAINNEVSKFLYVSAISGDKHRTLKIFEAKERFVDELKSSGLDYIIMRPNGFFSDMRDFLEMAKSGRVYLFGDGKYELNPIDGEDLAKVCVEKMLTNEKEATVGGPDVLSQNEIGELALRAWKKEVKISHLPDWVRKFIIWFMRTFTKPQTYGPFEFFLTAMASNNVAPRYGYKRLKEFFYQETKDNG